MNFNAETSSDEKIKANVNILYELHDLINITLHAYYIARLLKTFNLYNYNKMNLMIFFYKLK